MTNEIIIIANTYYHFEITLSAYQTLIDSKYKPIIYMCHNKLHAYMKQLDFLKEFNISYTTNLEELPITSAKGLVVSAYPNKIPNGEKQIFNILNNKLVYVCHRFNTIPTKINPDKTICLSPLAKKNNLAYFLPNSYPMNYSYKKNTKTKLLIQAHFETQNRDLDLVVAIIDYLSQMDNIELHIVGTGIPEFVLENMKGNIFVYSRITEQEFYSILSNMDYLLPLIDNRTKNGTYLKQRYSSSFCHSFCMNKPIIAHRCFREIYGLPGIYYGSYDEFKLILSNIHSYNIEQMINNFDHIRKISIEHNRLEFDKLFT